MDRIYLDYNATSPLAPAVTRWLAEGELFWANPASQHSSGKRAAFHLSKLKNDIGQLFSLNSKRHRLVFHSGATEGVNAAITGLWLSSITRQRRPLLAYSALDHACVRAQAARWQALGHAVVQLVTDDNGDLAVPASIEAIKVAQLNVDGPTIVNFTWVNNESGVVWPLEQAVEIKRATGALIHVDAAQAIGKVADCWALHEGLDAYSFSSHKCGGLKSHGWSFYHQSWPGEPLLLGGGQQQGYRSGTEDPVAAHCLWLALEEIKQNWRPQLQADLIKELRHYFDQQLVRRGQRVAVRATHLNLNTILFVSHLPSDMALPLFDLAGLELSAGAACSSGAAQPSPVLEALGLGSKAKNGLRLSTSWGFSYEQWASLQPRLTQVLEKLPVT